MDKNVQRRLLRKRSCEAAQQQREDKAAKEICLIKEIVTGPLEGISSSESDSAGSETSQGFISETAGANRQDFVKLYVPKRIATTSQVVSAADMHRISSNALNDVLAAIIRESNGDLNEFVLSKASTLRGRKQARHSEFGNIKESFKNSTIREFVTIHWDEKRLKQSGDVQQTPHTAVLSSNGNDSKLLGTTGLRRGTGLQQAEAIKELLGEWDLTDSCVAMCSDTTAANTGRFSGACILLEAILDRSLLWIACRHHMLEVVLSQVFKSIFGDSVGPSVELFQQLKNQWQSVDFTQSTYHLNQSTTACLQEDVKHAYQSLVKIKSDPSYLARDDYEELLNFATYYIIFKFFFSSPWSSTPCKMDVVLYLLSKNVIASRTTPS